MKMKYLKNYLLIVFVVPFLFFQSCKDEESKLELLQEQLLQNGYDDFFDKPGRMEKTALNVVGIKDALIYSSDELYVVFIEIDKDKDFDDISQKVLPIILNNISQEDMEKVKTMQDNMVTNEDLAMLYYGELRDDKLSDIFKNI